MFLDDMDFGFEEKTTGFDKTNVMGFLGAIASIASSVIGGIFGDDDDDDPDRSVQPGTTSGQKRDATDIMFDEQAKTTLKNLATKMSEWGDIDRDFMENSYRPFQEELIATNTELVNLIGMNSKTGLEQSIKDLTGGDALKQAFRETIGEAGANISETANRFMSELNNLPTTEERVGQAASAVEQQFGKAGADIRGRLKAQGQNISQATERDLAIRKATAKAGAVGAAAEGARAERMNALSQGVGVFSNLQASQSDQLATQVQQTQQGVGLIPQIEGITEPDTTAAGTGAELQAGLGLTQIGVNQESSDISTTQTGVTTGNFVGLPEDVGSRDMILEEKETARKAAEIHAAQLKRAQEGDPGRNLPRDSYGNSYQGDASRTSDSNTSGLANGGFSGGGAIGGVSDKNQPDRSGSGGQGGMQQ